MSVSGGADGVVHHVATEVHGRYLVSEPSVAGPWPVLLGFHGYGEDASDHLSELKRIPGSDGWLVVSAQALHPFYTRQQRVVASWMTRLDREHAIADNIAYVERVVADLRARHETREPLVFAGFSQGGAMGWRAAAHIPAQGLIVLASDVPPDVVTGTKHPLPPVLIGRGTEDNWYTAEKQEADVAALRALAAKYEVCVFNGGHEWTDDFRAAAGEFLRTV